MRRLGLIALRRPGSLAPSKFRALSASFLFCCLGTQGATAQSVTNIGDLDGSGSEPSAISADGTTVVGGSSVSGRTHAFRWTSATGIVDLLTLGGSFSYAEA